ncbi:CCC motif membrane protein [Capnocytophaga sp. ARDL2]|uniref:CCC motif membrane protein n=1 Tax=Capnocytophaga sp. ARDL2 TaxID=3238809 RepID=UPI003558E036
MNYQTTPNFNNQMQEKLPNATAVLILGIVSIVLCLCYGIPGIIAGIVAIVLYNKDKKLYKATPEKYDNYSTLNTGFILSIIGIILSTIYAIFTIGLISYIGFDALKDPEALQQKMQELQEQMEDSERENF